MLERVEFTPSAGRADLDGPRIVPRRLYAAAERIGGDATGGHGQPSPIGSCTDAGNASAVHQ